MLRRSLFAPAFLVAALPLALVACSDPEQRPSSTTHKDAGVAGPDATTQGDATTNGDAMTNGDATSSGPDGAIGEDASALDGGATSDDAGEGKVNVTFEVTVPADTPAGDPVHIAGNFQNWSPSDPGYVLTAIGGNRQAITLAFDVGQSLEFKFVRGDWARVEKGPNGEEISNRTLTVPASGGTFSYTVARWADGTPTPSTRSGDVTDLQVPSFLNGRRVWIYLPPGYRTNTTTRYPVLYMLDGQNVFDASTSFSGEWEVDETLESLIPAGEVTPMIVVASDNGGGARIDEYTPWLGDYMGTPAGGDGEAHLQAIIGTLKPWVDANYRTLTGPENTGFAGSSLGGLMAVYAAYTHSDVFGRIAGLSPSIWWDNDHLLSYVQSGAKPPVHLWIDTGTAEGDLPTFEALVQACLDDGFIDGVDFRSVEAIGAGHNEAAWAARMPDILRFLFPASP